VRGVNVGCPLSPVMEAIYTEPLDRRLEATGLTYARFMDDWAVPAPSRWSLRRAARIVNETLRELRLEQHPDKTFVGRTEWGFTFLGYWIAKQGRPALRLRHGRDFKNVLSGFMSRMPRRRRSGGALGNTSGTGSGEWSVVFRMSALRSSGLVNSIRQPFALHQRHRQQAGSEHYIGVGLRGQALRFGGRRVGEREDAGVCILR
jgi:hypothetical protein